MVKIDPVRGLPLFALQPKLEISRGGETWRTAFEFSTGCSETDRKYQSEVDQKWAAWGVGNTGNEVYDEEGNLVTNVSMTGAVEAATDKVRDALMTTAIDDTRIKAALREWRGAASEATCALAAALGFSGQFSLLSCPVQGPWHVSRTSTLGDARPTAAIGVQGQLRSSVNGSTALHENHMMFSVMNPHDATATIPPRYQDDSSFGVAWLPGIAIDTIHQGQVTMTPTAIGHVNQCGTETQLNTPTHLGAESCLSAAEVADGITAGYGASLDTYGLNSRAIEEGPRGSAFQQLANNAGAAVVLVNNGIKGAVDSVKSQRNASARGGMQTGRVG